MQSRKSVDSRVFVRGFGCSHKSCNFDLNETKSTVLTVSDAEAHNSSYTIAPSDGLNLPAAVAPATDVKRNLGADLDDSIEISRQQVEGTAAVAARFSWRSGLLLTEGTDVLGVLSLVLGFCQFQKPSCLASVPSKSLFQFCFDVVLKWKANLVQR